MSRFVTLGSLPHPGHYHSHPKNRSGKQHLQPKTSIEGHLLPMAEGIIIGQQPISHLIPIGWKELCERANALPQNLQLNEHAAQEGHSKGNHIDYSAYDLLLADQRTNQEGQRQRHYCHQKAVEQVVGHIWVIDKGFPIH